MQYVKGRNIKRKKKFLSVGYIFLIVIAVIFIIRAGKVVNNYRERGGLAYVQLLNFSMPVVETQIYDESAYRENTIDIKRVAVEALGLNNITTYGIVGSEVSFFKNAIKNTTSIASTTPFKIFEPYEVKEEIIARVTEEELAELNSVSAAYDPSLKKTLDPSNVEVLIYHTHNQEAYSEVGSDSENEDFSVIGVGGVLASELEEGYGISSIHDKTVHCIPPYAESYFRSEPTVQSYLNQFPNLKLIIDLHRDGGPSKEAVTTVINDQSLAKLEFVTSQNSPNYGGMMEVLNSLTSIGNNLFPGLLRSPAIVEWSVGSNTFNQKLSPKCILVEFGADTNTAQEAKLSAKYFARIIAEYLNR